MSWNRFTLQSAWSFTSSVKHRCRGGVFVIMLVSHMLLYVLLVPGLIQPPLTSVSRGNHLYFSWKILVVPLNIRYSLTEFRAKTYLQFILCQRPRFFFFNLKYPDMHGVQCMPPWPSCSVLVGINKWSNFPR